MIKYYARAPRKMNAIRNLFGGPGSFITPDRFYAPEKRIETALKRRIPGLVSVDVYDISGGCGDMYQVDVQAKEFSNMPLLHQHRLVVDSLKEEIRGIRGIRINTFKPSCYGESNPYGTKGGHPRNFK